MRRALVVLVAAVVGCGGEEPEPAPARRIDGHAGVFAFVLAQGLDLGEGANELRISLVDAASEAAVEGATVRASGLMPSMGHEPDEVEAQEAEPGAYQIEGLVLDMPGTWEVRLAATLGATSDDASFVAEIP